MNTSEHDFIHSLGPDAVQQIINEYDNLYSSLEKLNICTWQHNMKSVMTEENLQSLKDMLTFYEYVNCYEKIETVKIWLKIVAKQ